MGLTAERRGSGKRPAVGGGWGSRGNSRATASLGTLYLNHNIRQISIHISLLDSERNIAFPRGMGVPTPRQALQSPGSQSDRLFPLACVSVSTSLTCEHLGFEIQFMYPGLRMSGALP